VERYRNKMTVHPNTKSSSAPPRSASQDATTLTENWRTSNREQLKSLEKDKAIKNDILKLLSADRTSIVAAKKRTAKRHDFHLLDESEQERQTREAVLLCVKQRIDDGRCVSCTYPEFAGFIPHMAFGVKRAVDPLKAEFMTRPLAALRKEREDSGVGYASSNDDDDEDPLPCKIEEPTKKQKKMSDFLPFAENHEPHLSKDSSGPGHEDGDDKDKSDRTTSTGRRSQGRKSAPHTLKRKRVDRSNGKKKKVTTWRAVSRGEPLPPGSPVVNFEQRKPKINPWLGRFVFRGQIMTEDGKDED
jgi:hypothetical protein